MNKNRNPPAKKNASEILKDIPEEVIEEVEDFLAKIKDKYPQICKRSLTVLIESSQNLN